MSLKFPLSVLLLLSTLLVLPAQPVNRIEVRGVVLDADTQKPVPFANVSLLGAAIGTTANDDGAFALKLPGDRMPDSLVVSYVGYHRFVAALAGLDPGKPLTVRLKPAVVLLNEVVVKAPVPTDLIRDALAAVPANYETRPVRMQGFYRETVQENDSLISLAEAVIAIHKTAYADPSQPDQMKLLKGRKSRDVKESDLLDKLTISGGLRVDFVKIGLHPLVVQNFGLYDYTFQNALTSAEDTVYTVAFDQKEGVKMPLLKGRVFIDSRTLAFTGIEYGYSPRGIRYVNQYSRAQRKKMKKADFILETVSADTRVNFTRRGAKWYLQSANSEYEARIGHPRQKRTDSIAYRGDLSITSIETGNAQPIPKEEQLTYLGGAADLGRQIGQDYDQAFWEQYNYIVPPADIRAKSKQLLLK